MEYVLLIYADETIVPGMTEAGRDEIFAAYRAYDATLREAGEFRGAVRLADAVSATSVRLRDGKALVTDGPFAETREQLAGLFIIECESLDEALERARQLPGARIGTIEVRPIRYRS